jgi:hypothetical protein
MSPSLTSSGPVAAVASAEFGVDNDDVEPAFARVGGVSGREDRPPINEGGPSCTDESFVSCDWFGSADKGFVAAAGFGCEAVPLVCDEAGSFELDATIRGRVTDEATCDDDAPVEGFDVDLLSPEFAPVDGEVERLLFPAELDGLTLLVGSVPRESPFIARELS